MPPKAKGAKAKRSKTKGDDPQAWLETRISELTLALQGRGIFVPAPEDEPASITHSKGATEKRRLTGNTKATQKAMRNMHLQMLEQRVLQLERLLNDASSDSGETKSAGGGGGGGVIFGPDGMSPSEYLATQSSSRMKAIDSTKHESGKS
eukprot:COSAG06_NODE_3412_length_5381_cov_5.527262_9_plen_150_part_00